MKTSTDLTGHRFGRWVVLGHAPKRDRLLMERCRCDCGTERLIPRQRLLRGASNSCGCRNRERIKVANTTHGESTASGETRLYRIWTHMKGRCADETDEVYGKHGIRVCPEWSASYEVFRDWAHANGYAPNLTIDRVDNDANYEPANCRWATRAEQARNRRTTRLIDFNGETKSLTEWAEATGITKGALCSRLRCGWPLARALTEPSQRGGHA